MDIYRPALLRAVIIRRHREPHEVSVDVEFMSHHGDFSASLHVSPKGSLRSIERSRGGTPGEGNLVSRGCCCRSHAHPLLSSGDELIPDVVHFRGTSRCRIRAGRKFVIVTQKSVIIVGAGMAGLRAAELLVGGGHEVTVFEGADRVGGRIVTDRVDGFTLDRGFQLLNPSYPQVRASIDLAALELGEFAPGVVVSDGVSKLELADPLRRPLSAPGALFLKAGSITGKIRLGRLLMKLRFSEPSSWNISESLDARRWLLSSGVDNELIEQVLRPFLSGVLLEDALATSANVVALLLRSFLRGMPAVPAKGMAALPSQVADRLPLGTIRLKSEVVAVTAGGVTLSDGTHVNGDHVIVGVGAERLLGLVPQATRRATNAVTTWWFAADQPLSTGATLVADRQGRVLVNSVDITAAAPSYSPNGKSLIAASALGFHENRDSVAAVTKRLAELHHFGARTLELLRIDAVRDALPALPPPTSVRPPIVFDGVILAGDHVATPSIQGAMASGARAARRILELN